MAGYELVYKEYLGLEDTHPTVYIPENYTSITNSVKCRFIASDSITGEVAPANGLSIMSKTRSPFSGRSSTSLVEDS